MIVKLASYIDKAKLELDLIGMTASSKDWGNREARKNILELLKVFSKQGHSGFSASYVSDLFDKLSRHKILSPLTGKDSEWNDVTEMSCLKGGKKLFQNKRASNVFKDEKGKAYDIRGLVFEDKDGNRITSNKSKILVKFPYMPTTKIIKDGAK